MAHGDPQLSPVTWAAGDYLGRQISVTWYFNDTTRALTNTSPAPLSNKCAIVHRDDGCLFTKIVVGDPADPNSPRLLAPADGQPDAGYTVNQVRNASKTQLGFPGGWQTFEDTQSTQITAER